MENLILNRYTKRQEILLLNYHIEDIVDAFYFRAIALRKLEYRGRACDELTLSESHSRVTVIWNSGVRGPTN